MILSQVHVGKNLEILIPQHLFRSAKFYSSATIKTAIGYFKTEMPLPVPAVLRHKLVYVQLAIFFVAYLLWTDPKLVIRVLYIHIPVLYLGLELEHMVP